MGQQTLLDRIPQTSKPDYLPASLFPSSSLSAPPIMSHQDVHLDRVSGHLPTVVAPPAPTSS